MFKVLVKMQFAVWFRGYFYSAKKNKMRSKAGIVAYFILFFMIMVVMLGGMFSSLSLTLCGPLCENDLGWMYFLMLGGISIVLGAFGSVFNTFSALYLSKDNDLLLSLPIPVRDIVAARLVSVYLMGTMYEAAVFIPAIVVYCIVNGVRAEALICEVLMFFIISLIILILSCVLGWCVARISLKLKSKNIVTVIVSLLFIGGYYFFYFRASVMIRHILANSQIYGSRIKSGAYPLYVFGSIGEGNVLNALLFTAVLGVLTALIWNVMLKSFINIATSTGRTGRVRYREKAVKEKSIFTAVLSKEFGRFTSSSAYMLNCGLGTLLLPAMGIYLLIYDAVPSILDNVFSSSGITNAGAILICTMLCLVATMNDMAAPSVSLEGKNLWLPQSLPIDPKLILYAKASVQLILSGIPMLIAVICAVTVVDTAGSVRFLIILTAMMYVIFSAFFNVLLGIKMPLLNWTSEIAPIKQSGGVFIAMFGGWGVCALMGGLYLFIGYNIGAAVYLLIWTLLFAAASFIIIYWLNKRGSVIFSEL